ncbi:outer membrane beta-barrel protein [Bacteroidota bacterium]
MRRSFFIILFIIGVTAFGQSFRPKNLPIIESKKFHLGYTVGIGVMDYRMSFNEGHGGGLNVKNAAIFIGMVSDLSITKYTSLRFLPGISFGQRDIRIDNSTLVPKIETVFVELPLLYKYRAKRHNNFAPYLIGGFNARFDLTGGELVRGRVAERLVKIFDIYYELGVGFVSYLQNVRVATELKFSIGLRNVFSEISTPEYMDYTMNFNGLYSKIMVLSFHIE